MSLILAIVSRYFGSTRHSPGAILEIDGGRGGYVGDQCPGVEPEEDGLRGQVVAAGPAPGPLTVDPNPILGFSCETRKWWTDL